MFIFVGSRCTALATLNSFFLACAICLLSASRSGFCSLRSSLPLATLSVSAVNTPPFTVPCLVYASTSLSNTAKRLFAWSISALDLLCAADKRFSCCFISLSACA